MAGPSSNSRLTKLYVTWLSGASGFFAVKILVCSIFSSSSVSSSWSNGLKLVFTCGHLTRLPYLNNEFTLVDHLSILILETVAYLSESSRRLCCNWPSRRKVWRPSAHCAGVRLLLLLQIYEICFSCESYLPEKKIQELSIHLFSF